MPSMQRFAPHYNSGQIVPATATSAQVTITKNALGVRVTNLGSTNVAYVRVGSGTIVATTADYPVRANSEVWITKSLSDDQIAYISASGTSLHIIDGEGL